MMHTRTLRKNSLHAYAVHLDDAASISALVLRLKGERMKDREKWRILGVENNRRKEFPDVCEE